MSRFMFAVSALVLLAGQALSLNVTLGSTNFTVLQLLEVPTGTYSTPCASLCNTANSTIQDGDDVCLCTNTIGSQLVMCEQCMMDNLVELNLKAPDVRVGSNAAISAYSTACNASQTAQFVFAPPIALTQSPAFNTIQEPILNTPETVVVVGFGAILGASALFLFANI
ncbi:hypothetical protein SCHPADRAFT_106799 [Schizopora paradoxa]|uniref:Extracellular membrane protein CFEM domain-containing protein n=1 Tax=Schizopora paradoxa TaxID=27342 RepID=A0A0H2SNQ4_9AGAM|nr:hypothetical protein SCHPADRAFT_106799 [Schizopora paradoxa]